MLGTLGSKLLQGAAEDITKLQASATVEEANILNNLLSLLARPRRLIEVSFVCAIFFLAESLLLIYKMLSTLLN